MPATVWLSPAIRMRKRAGRHRSRVVPPAAISTHHITVGTADFFAKIQDWHERWDPTVPANLRLSTADQIPFEFDESDLFDTPEFRRYEWEQAYDTEAYADLLLTYSPTIALPRRDELIADIRHLIDTRHQGRVVKRYLAQLATARVRSASTAAP